MQWLFPWGQLKEQRSGYDHKQSSGDSNLPMTLLMLVYTPVRLVVVT